VRRGAGQMVLAEMCVAALEQRQLDRGDAGVVHQIGVAQRLQARLEPRCAYLRACLGALAEIGKRHPDLGRLRLVVTRSGETDVMTLRAECASPGAGLQTDIAATLRAVTKLGGNVELVSPGSLPNDGKLIADER